MLPPSVLPQRATKAELRVSLYLMSDERVLDARDFEVWEEFLDAQGRDFRETLFEMIRSFGADFLEFVCAYGGNWSFVDSIPSDAQREVVAELRQIASDLATVADADHRRVATARKLGVYLGDFDTTRAIEWHRRCGGRVPTMEDDGSVEYAVSVLARDLLGIRLLESRTHPNIVVEKHPMYRDLFDRLDENEPLRSMFVNAISTEVDYEPEAFEYLPPPSPTLPLWSDGTSQTL